MQFLPSEDHRYDVLRAAVLHEIPKILMDDDGESDTNMADDYWNSAIRNHIAQHDYLGGYHRIKVAAEGENAFVGIDRIFRANVEGEPVGLLASSTALMGFTHVTHYAMTRAGLLDQVDSLSERRRSWGPLFRSGIGIANRMQHDSDINFRIARLQIMVIADWANNHRRLAH